MQKGLPPPPRNPRPCEKLAIVRSFAASAALVTSLALAQPAPPAAPPAPAAPAGPRPAASPARPPCGTASGGGAGGADREPGRRSCDRGADRRRGGGRGRAVRRRRRRRLAPSRRLRSRPPAVAPADAAANAALPAANRAPPPPASGPRRHGGRGAAAERAPGRRGGGQASGGWERVRGGLVVPTRAPVFELHGYFPHPRGDVPSLRARSDQPAFGSHSGRCRSTTITAGSRIPTRRASRHGPVLCQGHDCRGRVGRQLRPERRGHIPVQETRRRWARTSGSA
jgi:hypothetical protein